MKRTKRFLMLAPVVGLFLSGCTFQEGLTTAKDWASNNVLDPVKNWFDGITGKKQEEKSGGDVTPSGGDVTPSGGDKPSGEDTPKVNPLWPADDISAYLAEFQITDKVPGYTGDAKSIEFSELYGVIIEVPDGADKEKLLQVYVADIKTAGYKEYEEDSSGDMAYISPEGNLLLTPYTYEDTDVVYVLVFLSFPPAPVEVSTTFPIEKVKAELEITDNFPIPSGTSFEFSLDPGYLNSCYVKVIGGDASAYLSALDAAGFVINDYLEDYGMARATLNRFIVDFDCESNTTYTINYYIAASE